MTNVDIDIYFSNFKTFFKENPQELNNLIGNASDTDFFNAVYEKINENFKEGDELELTHKQIIAIVLDINKTINPPKKEIVYNDNTHLFQKTEFGLICLN